MNLLNQQCDRIAYWLPALACGSIAWLSFITVGQTPLVRATGLMLVIVGVALTLRRLGAAYAIIGGLALTYSPAFWSQTGGGESQGLATIVIAMIAGGISVVVLAWLVKRPYLGIALGLMVFAGIFWGQIGTPRSLRLTGFVTAWLLYFLINILRATNPHPDEQVRDRLDPRYIYAVLLLLVVGVLNDPLFALLAPAVALGLVLTKYPIPHWHWLIIGIVVVVGIRGLSTQYVSPYWWTFPAEQAQLGNIRVPYLLADGWRDASRWIGLFELVMTQFTAAGVVLGILGLSRLARWYPVLGITLMVAYAAYLLFGLMYFGTDRPVLLLPLLIIQIIWMTYAVYTFGQWLQKGVSRNKGWMGLLAPAAFTLMPLLLFLEIIGHI